MKTTTFTRLFSTAAVVGALAIPAAAQEEAPAAAGGINVSAEITVDYVTQYFFRGYEQLDSDQGAAFQPGASFTIPVEENITATIGTWASIHTDIAGRNQTSNPSALYETDIYGSIDATFGDFSVGAGLTLYDYPVLAGASVLEFAATASWDDSDELGDFAFNPTATLAVELNNTNSNSGGKEATYLGLGGAFSLKPLTDGTEIEAWSWSIPVEIGLSLDDYYNDASGAEETIGYITVGLEGSIPLSELIGTEEYVGAWDLTLGAYVHFLNADVNGGAGNGGFGLTDNRSNASDSIQYVGKIGISRSW